MPAIASRDRVAQLAGGKGTRLPVRRSSWAAIGRNWLPWLLVTFGPGAIKGAGSTTPGEIDYRLARRALISEYRKGRLAQHEVCDAHPELVRNARECSEPSRILCPICEAAKLVLVTYVFGPRLPASGRCITTKDELRKLA